MQVVWFNNVFNHDHEAGVFSWNTKIIKIQISIGSIEIAHTNCRQYARHSIAGSMVVDLCKDRHVDHHAGPITFGFWR